MGFLLKIKNYLWKVLSIEFTNLLSKNSKIPIQFFLQSSYFQEKINIIVKPIDSWLPSKSKIKIVGFGTGVNLNGFNFANGFFFYWF